MVSYRMLLLCRRGVLRPALRCFFCFFFSSSFFSFLLLVLVLVLTYVVSLEDLPLLH